ncbi:hypothetical protein SNE35_27965 [Paucibacter sp. R3-3]|uniref:Lipoprotein n=1 Tax=Roseateles agri TaxID=3098619 RepID=A0ABU5DPW4_9BURK|nr:hypothetical protein [Paucibacter sp. R3-3]MDY0748367.1 hypothetical protein [Paucibacter sp. R3-3]
MKFSCIALLLPLIVAGCASTQTSEPVVEAKAECGLTYRVGSNIPRKECLPPQTPEERQRMQENLRNEIKLDTVNEIGR